MNYQNPKEILATKLVNFVRDRQGKALLKEIRTTRIREALGWTEGTIDAPVKHLVNVLPDGLEVYFLKPGKEAIPNKEGEVKNPNDMTPMVGEVYKGAQFKDIWVYLSRISALSFEVFQMVMALVYRSAYLLDHKEEEGRIRYRPNANVENLIFGIQEEIEDVLPHGGLLGLLNFLDILGWNEDVKYHSDRDRHEPTFTGKYKSFNTGRINTLLTMVKVPFEMYNFLSWVIDNVECMRDVDFEKAYNVTQQLTVARGVSPASQSQIFEWLTPFVYDKEPIRQLK